MYSFSYVLYKKNLKKKRKKEKKVVTSHHLPKKRDVLKSIQISFFLEALLRSLTKGVDNWAYNLLASRVFYIRN